MDKSKRYENLAAGGEEFVEIFNALPTDEDRTAMARLMKYMVANPGSCTTTEQMSEFFEMFKRVQ